MPGDMDRRERIGPGKVGDDRATIVVRDQVRLVHNDDIGAGHEGSKRRVLAQETARRGGIDNGDDGIEAVGQGEAGVGQQLIEGGQRGGVGRDFNDDLVIRQRSPHQPHPSQMKMIERLDDVASVHM